MGATRTIRRGALVAGVALLYGCSKNKLRHQPSAELPKAVVVDLAFDAGAERPRPTPTPAPLPSAVAGTLRTLREQRLEIVPPTVQSAQLAFGSGRLLQASFDKATFRDSKQGQVVTESSIGTVLAVAHGSDGSLFAIGASAGARLEPRMTVVKRFPHVTFLPGSRLLPDLETPSRFFVYYPAEPQLYSYSFANDGGPILAIEASFRLEGCREPLAQLRDGAIVCRTANGFLRQAPRGSHAEFNFPASDDPWVRLLPSKRLDEFFAVSRGGEVSHLRLAERLVVLARFRLPAAPYAATANSEALAFVLVDNPRAEQARRWSLLVTDLDGNSRFGSDLPAVTASADEDWLPAVVADKGLAISGFEPLVAVGGERNVTVWDYSQGRELFRR